MDETLTGTTNTVKPDHIGKMKESQNKYLNLATFFKKRWTVTVIPMTATRVQILDEAVYISHSTNTRRKGMNPSILSPAMGKS